MLIDIHKAPTKFSFCAEYTIQNIPEPENYDNPIHIKFNMTGNHGRASSSFSSIDEAIHWFNNHAQLGIWKVKITSNKILTYITDSINDINSNNRKMVMVEINSTGNIHNVRIWDKIKKKNILVKTVEADHKDIFGLYVALIKELGYEPRKETDIMFIRTVKQWWIL